MNVKQMQKQITAGLLAAIMVAGTLPMNAFAETFKTKDPTTGMETTQTTDWILKEENLKGKNFWPLAEKQYLREVSTLAEPMKNPMIGYGGYFIRPDGL